MPGTKLSLAALTPRERDAFVAGLGHVFEHAPWVAARTHARRPFADREALRRAMLEVVDAASLSETMALLAGHPELAGKALAAGEVTADSAREQGGAGLDRLAPEELTRFQALNAAYRAKFGFPFIMAVKGRTKQEILDSFARRTRYSREAEYASALEQVALIAGLRLAALINE